MYRSTTINNRHYVYEETDTQVLGVDNSNYANKCDVGIEYVGKQYKTAAAAKRAAARYNRVR